MPIKTTKQYLAAILGTTNKMLNIFLELPENIGIYKRHSLTIPEDKFIKKFNHWKNKRTGSLLKNRPPRGKDREKRETKGYFERWSNLKKHY